jgi:hypothetical protein
VDWLSHVAGELALTVADGGVWTAIALALILLTGTLALGLGMVRRTQLLREEAPGAEIVGVSLATGLLVVACVWAAIRSGGQSAFVPVALALVAGVVTGRGRARGFPPWRTFAPALISSAAFVVAVALLYGSTMAPSVRDGVQPVEYPDEAFYAVLSRDLAASGRETTLSATGFGPIPGLPAQSWYHWGELWLGAAVGSATGLSPMLARYQVVLPLVLLATVLLAGTLVRLILKTTSPRAFAFGVSACLFLVPVPLIAGPFYTSWAFGMTLGITLYGLAAPAALLAIYAFAGTEPRAGWRDVLLRGSIAAALLPTHIVVAGLAVIGATAVAVVRRRQVRAVSPGVVRLIVVAGGLLLAGGVWGVATGHGLGGATAGASRVTSFNATWSLTIAITVVGGGIFLAIPIAWLLRIGSTLEQALYVFVVSMIAIGAVIWGARLADGNAFYAYFAGLQVFAPPIAAVATLRVHQALRERRWLLMAATLTLLAIAQTAWGAAHKTMTALVTSGPLPYREPIPVEVLNRIRTLPVDARLGYACGQFEEATFAQPQLLSIDLHTARRVVPLCFQADGLSWLVGGTRDPSVANESFAWAPQRELYPDGARRASEAAVATWLRTNGIEYVYVDLWHPSPVGELAAPIVTVGTVQVLRLR